jgi:hypothetical protein
MASAQTEGAAAPDENRSAIVVGGGIAGLYCARELAARGLRVILLEARDQLGGRIETVDLRGFLGSTLGKTPCFKGECGPMRFERSLQPLFFALCEELGIEFEPFTPTSSLPHGEYLLPADECGDDGTPLISFELLKLGVFRMFGQATTITVDNEVVLQNPKWLADLRDDVTGGFDELRRAATFVDGRPLYDVGFANALRTVLSNPGYQMIEREGTFYHLIPENPSAVEWGIFWLRVFMDPTLETIPGGVREVTERFAALLQTKWANAVTVKLQHEAISLSSGDGGVSVEVIDHKESLRTTITAGHVFLALPRLPLTKLAVNFPEQITVDLDAVIGFQLVKAFLCMRRPAWWYPTKPEPHEFAWNSETRELHYFLDASGTNGMVLLYTDRPKSQVWASHVLDRRHHDRAQLEGDIYLKMDLVRLLLSEQRKLAAAKVNPQMPPSSRPLEFADPVFLRLRELIADVEGLQDHVDPALTELTGWVDVLLAHPDTLGSDLFASVSDFALRDWACEPFGAAAHAWAPRVKSWEVRDRFRAFGLSGREELANVHICGEAYSDYQGFIEGALRSTRDACSSLPQPVEVLGKRRNGEVERRRRERRTKETPRSVGGPVQRLD